MKLSFWVSVFLTAAISALALIGWASDQLLLASAGKNYYPMAPLTAISFFAISVSMAAVRSGKSYRKILFLVALALVFAALDVMALSMGLANLGIEELIMAVPGQFGEVPSGRMSPITAVGIILISGNLLLTAFGKGTMNKIVSIVNVVLLVVSVVLLVGYLFDSPLLYGQTIIPVALPTSICFLLSTFSILVLNGKDAFPLSLFVGEETHARLLRFFLPLTALLVVSQGAFQALIRSRFLANETLVIAIFTILSLLIVTLVTVYLSRLISKKIDHIEAEKLRLISIIEATPDIVGICDSKGIPLYLNHEALYTFGLTARSPLHEMNTRQFYPEWAYQIIVNEGLPQAYQSGIWTGETAILSKSGAEIPVSQVILHHKLNHGSESYFSTIIRDISQLKEQQREIERINKKLKDTNADLQQFAYSASHDLNEPLRMITSFMELLQNNYGPSLDEKGNEYIKFALDGGRRMKLLIADLLSYSQAGQSASKKDVIDLQRLLEEVKMNLFKQIEETKATVTVDKPLPEVLGYSSELHSLFQNLIANALKFSIRGTQPEVHFGYADNASEFIFSIRDNGIGIAPENQEKVFEVFKRLHRREEYPGTGMGLAICKKIVEHHGGRIWVQSDVGKGSTFYVALPKS